MAHPLDVIVLSSDDLSVEIGNLREEVAQAKAAVLYGDRVTISTYRLPVLVRLFLLRMLAFVREGTFEEVASGADLARLLKSQADDPLYPGRPDGFQIPDADATTAIALFETMTELLIDRRAEIEREDLFNLVGRPALRNYSRWKELADPEEWERAAKDLVTLVDSGLVAVDLGDPRLLLSPEILAQDIREQGATRSMLDVLERFLAEGALEYPLFTRSGRVALRDAVRDGWVPDGANFTRANRVEIAASLISNIPAFPTASADEVLDVRARVHPHLARFRAAVIDLEAQLDAHVGEERFEAAFEDARRETVDPALEELREALHDQGALGTLARSAPTLASSVLALGASVALGAVQFAAVAAVAAGLTTTAAKEFLERHRVEADQKKSRFFLLLEAERALSA